ncbi:septum formation initiator family protein [Jeotgalibacillus sp. ET6]|uniref:FtsB family cell division protein n=1 Tax=Jeotgalibacillus sp. ET6 TaxID=3037260 RepID=UPI002418A8EC|nr:septum formation initiator family protein [Jeotgalibacillus sp. ET6]MDG5473817.1 septum formation initiator family protein [Jeotgalibacillus sp. ET6]
MGNPRKNVTSLENQYAAEQKHSEQRRVMHKKRLMRRLSFFIVFAVVFGGLLISSMVTRANVLDEKKAEKVQLEEQVVQLKKDETKLNKEIEKLNDDDYIAKLARRDYFLSDEGEIIFNIPEDSKGTSGMDNGANGEDSE